MRPRVLNYDRHCPRQNLEYYVPREPCVADDYEEIIWGLTRPQKSISPRFFYDDRGSAIFSEICELPGYHLTRSESEILQTRAPEIVGMLPPRCRLVELGSGSATKTRHLLRAMHGAWGEVEYSPIDISCVLEQSSAEMLDAYPWLRITGVIDSYERGLEVIRGIGGRPSLIAFLGSSLGNFERSESGRFLAGIRASMRGDDSLLLGLDMVRDGEALMAAYDDDEGVTSRFNLNVLSRINAEHGADFDASGFEHHVRYNEEAGRVEMYLRSLRGQDVSIGGRTIRLREGELIHTEHSHKYTSEGIRAMLSGAGLEARSTWNDDARRFSLTLCSRA